MMDIPTRLFPPALLGGLAVYGAVTFIWLQPIVENRMAEKHLIPQCEAHLQHAENTTPVPDDPKRHELQMVIEFYENSPLKDLPGIREIIEVAKRKLQALQIQRPRISKIDRSNICGCAVDNALEKLGLKMTLHVGSLRTHTPNALKAIDQNILAIAGSGKCGNLPWQ